ncbi:PREDICTED: SLIT and NTRK-like protein 6, partial [Priapulus caudatus]|uniref:SLIT and NTRK-like protein 6 n=1 Tax=Priapulus caudatus TaxID=37621 RepID=A0ABM1F6T9_PRICU
MPDFLNYARLGISANSIHHFEKLDDGCLMDASNLTTLYLSNNAIFYISPQALRGLKKLQFLDLSYNAIEYIAPGTFKDIDEITTLRLEFNHLYTVSAGTFAGLKNLEFIHLEYNRISSVAVGAFEGAAAARTVQISANNLVTIKPGIFRGLSSVNVLTSIDKDVFNLTELTSHKVTVNLGGCKLDCQCDIDWLNEAPFTTLYAYCATPPELSTSAL